MDSINAILESIQDYCECNEAVELIDICMEAVDNYNSSNLGEFNASLDNIENQAVLNDSELNPQKRISKHRNLIKGLLVVAVSVGVSLGALKAYTGEISTKSIKYIINQIRGTVNTIGNKPNSPVNAFDPGSLPIKQRAEYYNNAEDYLNRIKLYESGELDIIANVASKIRSEAGDVTNAFSEKLRQKNTARKVAGDNNTKFNGVNIQTKIHNNNSINHEEFMSVYMKTNTGTKHTQFETGARTYAGKVGKHVTATESWEDEILQACAPILEAVGFAGGEFGSTIRVAGDGFGHHTAVSDMIDNIETSVDTLEDIKARKRGRKVVDTLVTSIVALSAAAGIFFIGKNSIRDYITHKDTVVNSASNAKDYMSENLNFTRIREVIANIKQKHDNRQRFDFSKLKSLFSLNVTVNNNNVRGDQYNSTINN